MTELVILGAGIMLLASQIDTKNLDTTKHYLAPGDPRRLLSKTRAGAEQPTPDEQKRRNPLNVHRARGQSNNDLAFINVTPNAANALLNPAFRDKYVKMAQMNRVRPPASLETHYNIQTSHMQQAVGIGYQGKAQGQTIRGTNRLPVVSTSGFIPTLYAGAVSSYKH
jgi:hypothetical protein